LPYEQRIEVLKRHNIGLWDAFHSCIRSGSMDVNIREWELNDFGTLKRIAPSVKLVCFNGKEAARAEGLIQQLGYSTRVLLSSSAANRKDVPGRLRCWKNALNNQR
jgi:hypoxanthine-DNA glycosylase